MSSCGRYALFAVPFLLLSGCHKEGPTEQAGQSLDKAGQKIEDAVNPPGVAQKAGRALDKTFE